MRIVFLGIMLAALITGCSQSGGTPVPYVEMEGDAARGEQLFSQTIEGAPPCAACHIPGSPASPDLTGYGAIAGERVPGESAHEYTYYSITEPGRFIVPGYGSAMYDRYGERLTQQQIADLIAYMLTL